MSPESGVLFPICKLKDGKFKEAKIMESVESKVVEWAMSKIDSYDNEKKLYNLSAILLSILDVVCGIIAIFYTAMAVTSVIFSILCGTVWGGRVIQLIKVQRLAKALKVMSTASIAYITVRKRRSEYMKKIFDNLKNNPLTIVFAILGGGVMGFAAYKLAQIYFVALPQWMNIIFAISAAVLTVALVILLGWDSLKSAILRSAKKVLSKDGYDALINYVDTLKKQEDKQAELAAKTAAHDKEIEQARLVIAEYEQRNAEYQKAIELLKLQSSEIPQQIDVVKEDAVETVAEEIKEALDEQFEEPSILSDMSIK